jgi:hypothetical protein
MLQLLKVFGIAAGLALIACATPPQAPAQTKADRAAICAKHADPARREACQKRLDELKASRAAKREAQAAKAKELQDRINTACAKEADRAKCERDEKAKLKAGRAKAKAKKAEETKK